ncbi:MAG: hypothetical protein HY815_22685 [Candidatus Riflebacteria bacterium]|nr:hypothetical protein [Candidatus Riflebacteria bacterium]
MTGISNQEAATLRRREILTATFLTMTVLCALAMLPRLSPGEAGEAGELPTKNKRTKRLPVSSRGVGPASGAVGEREDKPGEAQQFWHRRRQGRTGIVPTAQYVVARYLVDRLAGGARGPQLPSRLKDVLGLSRPGLLLLGPPSVSPWTSLGPGNVGGRTRALIVQPGGVMYAAGVAGGVWKTVDAGASWSPLSDFVANLAVCTLAADQSDPNRIYAGTGEGFFNIDRVRGAGIFVTTDAGATWSQLPSTTTADFHYVNRLAVSPTDPNVLYAATGTGVWRSQNQGATWTRRAVGQFLEMAVFDNAGMDNLFAWNVGDTIYRSLDAGDTFSASGTGIPAGLWRGSIAVADATRAYCALSTLGGVLRGFYQSDDNGSSWTQRATLDTTAQGRLNSLLFSNPLIEMDLDGNSVGDCTLQPVSNSGQGWYDNVIAVDPTDRNRIFLGGIDLWRSDDAGATWGLASLWWPKTGSAYCHADHHAIVFDPGYDGTTNQTVYIGNDGGVFRANNNALAAVATAAYNPRAPCGTAPAPAVSYTCLNNRYGVTQFYHGAVAATGTVYIGGTQDNGTLKYDPASPENNWVEIFGGDGGYCAIDPTNSDTMYMEVPYLGLRKSIDGGANSFAAVSGITEPTGNFAFISPFAMDPSNPNRLWIGGRQPWRTTDGAQSWTSANSGVTLTTGRVSAWAVAPSGGGQIVYLATQDGEVYRSADALATAPVWTPIRGNLPPIPTPPALPPYISSLAVHPTDPNHLFVTYSSFDVSGGQIFRTLDASAGGSTIWSPAVGSGAGSIPNLPVHVLVINPVDPTLLFVGTDLGVLASSDAAATWCNVNGTSLANVVVEHLAYQGPGTLFAFTHGRGVYRASANVQLVTVGTPNGGERLLPGTTTNVTWSVDPSSSLYPSIAGFDVAFSTDGGASFPVALATSLDVTTRSFSWDVLPGHRTLQGRVRVQASDSGSTVLGEDRSDGNFLVNRVPAASAGPTQNVTPSSPVWLDGSGSSDGDGDALTYAWTQTAGSPVSLSGGSTPRPSFVAPLTRGDMLRFGLVVSDGLESSTASTTVTVNQVPVASAGPDRRVVPLASVTLSGTASYDPDGSALTYLWTQVYGPPVGFPQTTPDAVFAAPSSRGTLMDFNLTASDDLESASDTVRVSVNRLPVADAGPDKVAAPATLVGLDGSRCSDPDGDSLTFLWTQTGGPAVSFPAYVATPTFTVPPTRGATLTFTLTVSDPVESSAAGPVTVRVNRAPVANAGPNQNVSPTAPVTLDGTGSSDPDLDPLVYHWTQVGGPPVSFDPWSPRPTLTAPDISDVTLVFDLEVSDSVETASSTVRVGVYSAPIAEAGADQIVIPQATVMLWGSCGGTRRPVTYRWTQTGGPPVSFGANAPNPTFTAPDARGAVLTFSLLVSDGASSTTDTVTVRVNRAPVASLASRFSVTPGAPVVLDATGSQDGDGDVLTYQWTQVGGAPVALNLAGAKASFTAPAATASSLVFRLVVTDSIESDQKWSEVDVSQGKAVGERPPAAATPSPSAGGCAASGRGDRPGSAAQDPVLALLFLGAVAALRRRARVT